MEVGLLSGVTSGFSMGPHKQNLLHTDLEGGRTLPRIGALRGTNRAGPLSWEEWCRYLEYFQYSRSGTQEGE